MIKNLGLAIGIYPLVASVVLFKLCGVRRACCFDSFLGLFDGREANALQAQFALGLDVVLAI